MPLAHRPRTALSLAILAGLLATGAATPPTATAPLAATAPYSAAAAPPRAEGVAGASTGATPLRLEALSAQGFVLRGGRMQVSAALLGARAAVETRSGEHRVFRGAGPWGGAVSYRFDGAQLEDFVELPGRPPAPEVRYELHLGGVEGLRLVANTLELLDAEGTPGLRVAPPYLIGADGVRHPAWLGVEGCAVDTDPRPPWGRPVTSPGSARCWLRVRWGEQGLRYPALLDPTWMAASSAIARAAPALVPLASGHTMVIGGIAGSQGSFTASAVVEIFDPVKKTFTAVDSMTTARHGHTATLLPGGRVLVVGGQASFANGPGPAPASLDSAEIYEGGKWSPAAGLGAARAFHTATALPSGQVLVLGGLASGAALDTAEVFNPFASAEGKWNGAASMPVGRYAHTATTLLDDRTLVAGGLATGGGVLKDAQLFDPKAPSGAPWSAAGSLSQPRAGHSAIRMPGGQVLLAGGCSAAGGSAPLFLDNCDEAAVSFVFSPALKQWSTFNPPSNKGRLGLAVVGLRNGWVLTAGGRSEDGSEPHSKEVSLLRPFDAETAPPGSTALSVTNANWSWAAPFEGINLVSDFRAHASAVVDARGGVLVVGGLKKNAQYMAVGAADYLAYRSDGEGCELNEPLECASGRCIKVSDSKNVCCSRACDDPCSSCLAEQTGLVDGLCGPIAAKEGKACKASPACSAANAANVGRCSAGTCADFDQDCGHFDCKAGTGCPTTCDSNADCFGKAICLAQGGSKECRLQFDEGELCQADDECKSNHCEEKPGDSSARVCCEQDCAPDTCTKAGDGVLHSVCNGSLACTTRFEFCNGYSCGLQAKCLDTCDDTFPCTPDFFCDEGECKAKLEQGEPCGDDSRCLPGDDGKGHCVEGVCCNAGCSGGCESCVGASTGGLDGQCLPVPAGNDPKQQCTIDTGNVCGPQGQCNGARSCVFTASNVPCGQPTACDASGEMRELCNGSGECGPSQLVSCNGYGCDDASKGCRLSCTANEQCASGYACVEGKCLFADKPGCNDEGWQTHRACIGEVCSEPLPPARCPDNFRCSGGLCPGQCSAQSQCLDRFNCNPATMKCVQKATCTDQTSFLDADGAPRQCEARRRCNEDEPTRCLPGARCLTSSDCLPGFVCRSDGSCGGLAAPSGDDIDCYCAQPGRAGGAGPAAAALAALALGALRRTRRRAGS